MLATSLEAEASVGLPAQPRLLLHFWGTVPRGSNVHRGAQLTRHTPSLGQKDEEAVCEPLEPASWVLVKGGRPEGLAMY